ncbi:7 transmembrane sweet-taste receptor of 3 GCPR-domain-containing protein [Cladochytrium replicatum]|nr:7 transmembrane sweet-taste receptor of 3 GCPR-domain-containing protein [Cladochytrium replicatum]
MNRKVTPGDSKLVLYHDFDLSTTRSDGSVVFKDLSSNGFDLICNAKVAGTTGCPAEKSGIPMSGTIDDVYFPDNATSVRFFPLGQDPDDETFHLRIVVDKVPRNASLFADMYTSRVLNLEFANQVSYPFKLTDGSLVRPLAMNAPIEVRASENGGGFPYDSFTFHYTDTLLDSPTVTVNIYRKCNPGSYLDNVNKVCMPCPAGMFSTGFSYDAACTPCPAGTSQSQTGQVSCLPCQSAVLDVGNSTSINASLAMREVQSGLWIGRPDVFSTTGTFQDLTGQALCSPCTQNTYAIASGSPKCNGRIVVPAYLSVIPPAIFLGLAATEVQKSVEDKVANVAVPVAITIIGLIVASVAAGCLVLVQLYRKNPIIVTSSSFFVTITCAGIVLGALSVIPGGLRPSLGSCVAEIWMITLSGSIVVASLIAKTFRIFRIFNNPRLMRGSLSNQTLMVYIAGLLSGNVVLLIIWSVVSPPQNTVIRVGDSTTLIFEACQSADPSVQTVMLALLYIYNGVLLLVLSGLAYVTRTVKAAYNEAFYIAIFVSGVMFISLFAIWIVYLPFLDAATSYIVKAIIILFVCILALVTLVGVKLWKIWTRGDIETGNSKADLTLHMSNKDSISPVQLLKDSRFTDKVLGCRVAIQMKRLGVVYWSPKDAVLFRDRCILLLIDPDEGKTNAKKNDFDLAYHGGMTVSLLNGFAFCVIGSGEDDEGETGSGVSSSGVTSSGIGVEVKGTNLVLRNGKGFIRIQFDARKTLGQWINPLLQMGGKQLGNMEALKGTTLTTAGVSTSVRQL